MKMMSFMLDVDYWQATIMWCEPWQGGAKIKEIRESSGANIKAYQSCAPQVSAMIPDFNLKGKGT